MTTMVILAKIAQFLSFSVIESFRKTIGPQPRTSGFERKFFGSVVETAFYLARVTFCDSRKT